MCHVYVSFKDGLSKPMGGMRQERVWGLSLGPHMAGGMGQVGSRAIALGPIAQHELHSELICYSIQPAP